MTFPKLWVNKSFDNVTYFKYFANEYGRTKLHERKNKERIKVWESFVPFGSECFVLLFAIENINIKVYKSVVIIQPVVSSKYKIRSVTFGCRDAGCSRSKIFGTKWMDIRRPVEFE